MRHLLVYWKPSTVEGMRDRSERLRFAEPDQFGRVRPGDRLWVVSAPEGRLTLVGLLDVDEVTDRPGAERRLGPGNYWDAKHYALASPGSEPRLESIDLQSIQKELRFVSEAESARLEVAGGRVNPQQLQTMRMLTPESAARLNVLWVGRRLDAPRRTSERLVVGQAYRGSSSIPFSVCRLRGRAATGTPVPHATRATGSSLRPSAGRSGPGYENGWTKGGFHWSGRTGAQYEHPSIQSILNPDGETLLFWRKSDRAPFTFAGPVVATQVDPKVPVKILWSLAPAPSRAMQDGPLGALEAQHAQARGQGFAVSVEERKCIEDYAMNRAIAHFQGEGFVVENVCRSQSYDLRCTRDEATLYVEVKGSKGTGDEVILTDGEVRFAQTHPDEMVLLIVHTIKTQSTDRGPRASGGTSRVIRPWQPAGTDLSAISYFYSVPAEGTLSRP